MATVCCCCLAGTAACQHCSNNPFADDLWTNKTITTDHTEARPFGNGIDVCPVCGKPSNTLPKHTNADRVRSKSDEDLADWLWVVESEGRIYGPRGKAAWIKWLKQEAAT